MAERGRSFIDPIPGPFVAIDFETADEGADSACEIGIVRVEGRDVTRRIRQRFRPPRDYFKFTGIHGITWEDVEDKPTFAEAWPLLEGAFEGAAFIAAHNAGFDRGVLEACCGDAGLEPPALPWLCTARQARKQLGIFPANLANVARELKIPLNHHRALSDAEACARIVVAVRRVLGS